MQRGLRAARAAIIMAMLCGACAFGARAQCDDALASLASGLSRSQSELRVDGCGIASADVTRFVLVGQPFTQALRFGPGCDLEGLVTFDVRPARVALKVRRAGRVARLAGFLTSVSGLSGQSPFGFTTDLVDGELALEGGHQIQASVECVFGFGSILSIGRGGQVMCRVRVSSVQGSPARFSQSLVFGGARD